MARNAKQALIDKKEDFEREIKYYDMRINEARKRLAEKNNSGYDDSSSSESEIEYKIKNARSDRDLKDSISMLETCIQATQELTTLEVLDSEVNIMVDDPSYEGEPLITEDGVWKEVLTECRVDLIPFSMTFYSHHSKRLFGPVQYRGLQVKLVKSAHEEELSKSVLPDVTTPGDAVEVLRSYAQAHRSRRSTLARLVKKYGDLLFMEPMPGGGYILKCANVLEISWTLLNRWSHIAPFHHKMKFDLEYMDESYIKIITQTHKQLSDPSVDTDERTLLLDKIIETCLKARKDIDNGAESIKQTEESGNINNIKDSDIMAPPKTVPKKVKPKKRPNDNPPSVSKKPKIDNKENQMFVSNNKNKQRMNEAGSSGDSNKDENQKIASSKKDKNNEHTDTIESKEGNKETVENERNKVTNDNKPQTKTARNKDNVKQNATGNTKPQNAIKDNDIYLKQKEHNEVHSKEKQIKHKNDKGNKGSDNLNKVATTSSKDQNKDNVAISKDKMTVTKPDCGKSIKNVKNDNENITQKNSRKVIEKPKSKNVAISKNKITTNKADTVDGKANKTDKDNNEKIIDKDARKVTDKTNSKKNNVNVSKKKKTANKAEAVNERKNNLDEDNNDNITDNPRKDTDKTNSKNNNGNVAISKNKTANKNTDSGKISKTVKDVNQIDKNSKKVASTSSKNKNDDNVAISKTITSKAVTNNEKNNDNVNVAISKNKITEANKEDNVNVTDKNVRKVAESNSKNNNNVAMLKNKDATVRLEKNKNGKNLKTMLLNIDNDIPFKKPKVNVLDRPNVMKPYMQTLKDRFANRNCVASKDVERSSKIPKRIKALDARRNVLRLSPRLSQRPTFSK